MKRRGDRRPPCDPVEDDGVLDPAQTLEGEDPTADPLDRGITVPEHWSAAVRYGTTADELEQGETLDELLAEEEPPEDEADPHWYGPDDEPEPRAGRLAAEDGGDGELLARELDEESDGGPEEVAMSITSEDADRGAVLDEALDETLPEAVRAVLREMAAQEAREREENDE
ncbi:hypothetical protein [Actinomadura rugatobispora]|uniref:DUF5709 domain-containing protein n=1 Tax=Actinomadura rugatobispora TaxID=1994 RepID=A0ABW1A2F7_9ACTN|nr:hypothetical protein GCM10010200_049270 [Actinomadura rugatobispora]